MALALSLLLFFPTPGTSSSSVGTKLSPFPACSITPSFEVVVQWNCLLLMGEVMICTVSDEAAVRSYYMTQGLQVLQLCPLGYQAWRSGAPGTVPSAGLQDHVVRQHSGDGPSGRL